MVHAVVFLDVGFPLVGLAQREESGFPVFDLRFADALGADNAAPAVEYGVGPLLLPRRNGGQRAAHPLRCTDTEDAQATGGHMRQHCGKRRGSDFDMAAEHCGQRLARGFERDHFHFLDIHTGGLHRQCNAHVNMIADGGCHTDAEAVGGCLEALNQVGPGF